MNFNELSLLEAGFAGGTATDEYWESESRLKKELAIFIRTPGNLKALTTPELLHVCRMVGGYQPMALHAFFIYCSKEVE